jgi:hypothetical protein
MADHSEWGWDLNGLIGPTCLSEPITWVYLFWFHALALNDCGQRNFLSSQTDEPGLCLLDDVIRERVSQKLLKELVPYKVHLFV